MQCNEKVLGGFVRFNIYWSSREKDPYRWERLMGMTWHSLKADVAKLLALDKKRV